ncbi:MAG: TonB-dependent receptor domain-containing protein [Acidobacteriota bacterium]
MSPISNIIQGETMPRIILCVLLLSMTLTTSVAAQDLNQNFGTISGVVVSVANGAMISGVSIEVLQIGIKVESDLDGIYQLDLPAGKYDLRIVQNGFVEQVVKGVQVSAGEITYQDVALNPEGMQIGDVSVVAEAEKVSNEALLAERKTANTISDSIGAREMSRLTGWDAADAMQRVTGASIVDNRYVFIRGLGERYSNTMLNGSVLPSTQPDKKVVPLDLFPASLLENIRIEKSYTPDQPGEFAGGVIKIQTIDFPSSPTLKLSYGQGFGTNTTFQDFMTYPGGSLDWLGFDDGTRSIPGGIPSERLIRQSRFSSQGFSPEQLQDFGRSFSNVWDSAAQSAIPNQNFNLVAGNTFGKFGLVFALSQSNSFHNQDEIQNVYKVGQGGNVEPFHSYDFDISQRSVRTGVTANLAYELTDNHRFQLRNFFTKDTGDEARMFEGFNGDANNEIRDTRLRFVEEGIYSTQIAGEHYVQGLANSFLEWKLSYSLSALDEPDLRETLYEERAGVFFLADESQSGFRMFNNLDEAIWEPSLDWTTYFTGAGLTGSYRVGVSYRTRERDFSSRRFRFVPRNTQGNDLSQSPEEIFTPDNIRPDRFEVREETRPTDTYEAHAITRAAYGMVDLTAGRWRFIGGLRVEDDSQNVETFDPFDRQNPNRINSRLDNTDLLPALSVIYRLTPEANLRTSFSQTVNRPEFRELSPFEFTDVVGGRAIVGNPALTRSLIKNYDLRWEWFVSASELLSVSFFFKDFDDPIERFVQPTAQLRTSFLNADRARNLGFEFDVRKNLGLFSSVLDNFSVSANYTLVDSEVEIPERELNVLTSLARSLAGQSRHVLNTILEFENPGSRSVARLLFNYQGRRITDVGSLGLPDILQSGYPRLDAVFLQPVGQRWGLKFSAENLLDHAHEFTQGDQLQRSFTTGRVFSITLSRWFFSE